MLRTIDNNTPSFTHRSLITLNLAPSLSITQRHSSSLDLNQTTLFSSLLITPRHSSLSITPRYGVMVTHLSLITLSEIVFLPFNYF